MTKFTPGPWKVSEKSPQWIIGYLDANIAVAKVVNGVGQPSAANARLIAFAPEMYEMLKGYLAGLNQGQELTDPEVGEWSELTNLLNEIEGV